VIAQLKPALGRAHVVGIRGFESHAATSQRVRRNNGKWNLNFSLPPLPFAFILPAPFTMANATPEQPVIRHIANLWSLRDTPSARKPWPLERKIAAIKDAGFDGFTDLATPKHRQLAEKHGLIIVGYLACSKLDEFRPLLQQNKDAGARHINVQLGDHDTSTSDAVRLALRLMHEAHALHVEAAVEVHRDTCTETPEKTYALADGYQRIAIELLPITWDYSHLAVVKHLAPPFWDRLLIRPDLIQRSCQFHFRPFNGHHCQVPVTNGRGRLSPEVQDWLPLVERCLEVWLLGNQAGRELFAVPEMGPVSSGYNLHHLPDSWSEAIKLRGLIDKAWRTALNRVARRKKPAPLGLHRRAQLGATGGRLSV